MLSPIFLARRQNKFCRFLNRVINGCDINHAVLIPKSTKFEHKGIGVVIGKGVKLGENVTIYQNTTIGDNFDGNYPKIEKNVVIGANCVIVGNISVGMNSIIGANSFINKDVPANCLAYNKKQLIQRKTNT